MGYITFGNITFTGGGGGGSLDLNPAAISQCIAELYERTDGLARAIHALGAVTVADLDCDNIPKVQGAPLILLGNGAPAESVIPDNWNADTMGNWDGIPSFRGQLYLNYAAGSAVMYSAVNNTAVGDWKTA